MLQVVCKLFNAGIIFDSGIFPKAWSKGVILPLYTNKCDVNDPDNYRSITSFSCFGKPFSAFLKGRINNFRESSRSNILCAGHPGFRKIENSTVDHIFSLNVYYRLVSS